MSGSFSDSFFPSPTTPDEIINIVSSLKSSNSEGEDGINVNVIKASIDLLASHLSQMCNISFSTGIVPDKLKISKVLPIFKSEDSTNFTNYRPISILPCFSKILESAMHLRLMDYLQTTTTSLFLTLNIQISHHLQIARLIEAGGV